MSPPFRTSAGRPPSLHVLLRRLHLRMTLMAVCLVGCIVLIVGAVVIRGYTLHNLSLVGRSASYTAEAALVFSDREAAREALEWVVASDEVSRISVIRTDGVVLWAARDPAVRSSGVQDAINAFFFPEPVTAPVMHNGEHVGTIRLWGNADGVLNFLRAGLVGALGCMLLTAIAALVFARRLRRTILEPLQSFAEVTHTVRQERAFNRRVPSAPVAELAELAEDFNALLAELETWHDNLRSENESLAYRAMHDSLTGLPNRAMFEKTLSSAVHHARATGTALAVLFLDSDRFKETNDRYGHAAGDAVLIEVAARIRAQLREGDMVARIGGDEFAVLLAPVSGPVDEAHIAERITRSMDAPVVLPDGSRVPASLSIGIACFPDPCGDDTLLLQTADAAMYEAKRAMHSLRGNGNDFKIQARSTGGA